MNPLNGTYITLTVQAFLSAKIWVNKYPLQKHTTAVSGLHQHSSIIKQSIKQSQNPSSGVGSFCKLIGPIGVYYSVHRCLSSKNTSTVEFVCVIFFSRRQKTVDRVIFKSRNNACSCYSIKTLFKSPFLIKSE